MKQPIKANGPPQELKSVPQWLVWRYENARNGNKPTKVPYTIRGHRASTRKKADWTTYENACLAVDVVGFAGPGFVFTDDDHYFGVDLDNCLDDEGRVLPWAQQILDDFVGCYCEISPSGRGVKIFAKGDLPLVGTGRKCVVENGAIEIYQSGRYFTVTGEGEGEIIDATEPGRRLVLRYFGAPSEPKLVVDREVVAQCRRSLNALPDAVEGEDGSGKTFLAACEILRHGIEGDVGYGLLSEYNERKCQPPWSERELRHKWNDALRAIMRTREFGKALGSGFEDDDAVPFSLGLWDAVPFLAADFPQRYIIPGVLVEGEPFIIGGPQKSLKTTIALDLAVSLATGSPWLGHFEVALPKRVILLTGESGRPTTQRVLRRILAAKGVRLERDKFFLGFDLPQLSREDHLAELRKEIERTRAEVALIDPAYLCTLEAARSDSASNVFAMGHILKGLTQISTATGCLIGVVHHSRRSSGIAKEMPALTDLAFSGWPEWARQWVMLKPWVPFEDGRHRILAAVGGSAGHWGEFLFDIREAMPDFDGDGSPARTWAVEVLPPPELRGDPRKAAANDDEDEQKVLGLVAAGFNTRNKLKNQAPGFNGTRVAKLVQKLLDEKKLLVVASSKGGQVLGAPTE